MGNKSAVAQLTPVPLRMSVMASGQAMPLRAVLTRPQDRQNALVSHLQRCGWETLSVPALELAPLPGQRLSPEDLPQAHDWVMFVSRTAWQTYWGLVGKRWSPGTGIAVVGIATAKAIRQDLGDAEVQIMTPEPPGPQDSEALWKLLEPELRSDARVLIVAGLDGRTWLLEQLRGRGVDARVLGVYERYPAVLARESLQVLNRWSARPDAGSAGVWLMTSQHGIHALQQTLCQQGLLARLSPAAILVTHPRLQALARSFLEQTRALKDAPILVAGPDPDSLKKAFDAIRTAMGGATDTVTP